MRNQIILDLTLTVLHSANNQNLNHFDINVRVRELDNSITATEIVEAVEYLIEKRYVREEEGLDQEGSSMQFRYHLTFLGKMFYEAAHNESADDFKGKPFQYESEKNRVALKADKRKERLALISTWAIVVLTLLQVGAAFWDKVSPPEADSGYKTLEHRIDSIGQQLSKQ